MLPNTLMTLYQKQNIDLEELRNMPELLIAEPLGELDLLWVLSQLPPQDLTMKQIRFSTSDQTFSFSVTDGEDEATIEMTDYLVEVDR